MSAIRKFRLCWFVLMATITVAISACTNIEMKCVHTNVNERIR
jgi:hypothetical protein